MPNFSELKKTLYKLLKVLASKTDEWFFAEENRHGYNHYYSHVLMGRVAYPIDPNAINVENLCQ